MERFRIQEEQYLSSSDPDSQFIGFSEIDETICKLTKQMIGNLDPAVFPSLQALIISLIRSSKDIVFVCPSLINYCLSEF